MQHPKCGTAALPSMHALASMRQALAGVMQHLRLHTARHGAHHWQGRWQASLKDTELSVQDATGDLLQPIKMSLTLGVSAVVLCSSCANLMQPA